MWGLNLQERKVLLFLLILIFIGYGISFLKKTNSDFNFSLRKIYKDIEEINKFDLNKIDKETLIKLPGIGKKLATRIVEYRQKYGRFSTLEELKDIKGLSPSCYEKIKEYLYVR